MNASLTWLDIEPFIEAYEKSWSRSVPAELASFLPPRAHPHFLAILRELACVSLELNWPDLDARHFLESYPELAHDPESVRALTSQEERLRQPTGDTARSLHTHAQAPPASWRQQIATLHEQFQRLGSTALTGPLHGSLQHADLILALEREDPRTARMLEIARHEAEPDRELAGFRLIRELGRGTFGQVFLAQQKGLANRLVALKLGVNLFGESQTLAQLQHSHIVPVYSVHQEGPLQILCMPYFGATTLGDVLDHLREQGHAALAPNVLWSTLQTRRLSSQGAQAEEPASRAGPGGSLTALNYLKTVNAQRAILWLGGRLAEGLAHAHERGILHRDLKPANVLLADDGTPMLLDFNLSEDIRLRGGLPAVLGGTLPYMAPEHLQAFLTEEGQVDVRGDLYSLGLILYELLTGEHPFPTYSGPMAEQVKRMLSDRQGQPPSVRRRNPAVSPATEAIVHRCLHPDPQRRYATAAQLQEDLECQLHDRTLRHTREPSLREWGQKFVRRNPRLLWIGAAGALSASLLGLGVRFVQQSRQVEQVEAVNTRLEYREELRDARILLGLPSPDALERAEGESLCRRALLRYGLPDSSNVEALPGLAGLSPEEQTRARCDLGEMLLLLARATWLKSSGLPEAERPTVLTEALRLNELAEQLVGERDQRAVLLQQGLLLRQLNRLDEAKRVLERGQSLPPQTARDFYLLATEWSTQGEFRRAMPLFDEAQRREIDNAAVWASRGACLAECGQAEQAVAAFSTCLALRPRFWRAHLWRGQALLARGDSAQAEADFDEVLRHRPGFGPALILRGLARLALKRLKEAEADLTAALQADGQHTRTYFIRAQIRQLLGDTAGAHQDLNEGLRREPTDELSWIARGVAHLPANPKAALADFDQALRENHWSRDAAQNKAHVLSEYLKLPAEAIAVLDAVVKRYPDYTEARVGRGVLRARLGENQEARQDALEALRRDTRPLILYQAGCIYALTSRQLPDDRREAIRLLHQALRAGFGADVLEADADLTPLRTDKEYASLLTLARGLRSSSP